MSGYGSMVERQVANLKMGVRFSLPALTKDRIGNLTKYEFLHTKTAQSSRFCMSFRSVLEGDKPVGTGDKRHVLFVNLS